MAQSNDRWLPKVGDHALFVDDVLVRVVAESAEHPGGIFRVAYVSPGQSRDGREFDADIDELLPVPVDCPLKSRDPLPSCAGLAPEAVADHIRSSHLSGTQRTVQSYRTLLMERARALDLAAAVMNEEGNPGIALDLTNKASEFERLARSIATALMDEARARMGVL